MSSLYDTYYEEELNKQKAKAEEEYKRISEANAKISNDYVTNASAVVDASTSNAVGKVNTQITELPTYYQSAYDANAIQQKINERKVEERMANLGLTDSGLNRTQQTALAVSKMNKDAAITQQKNAAVSSLKQQIADLEASGELEKMKIKTEAEKNLSTTNLTLYNDLMSSADLTAQTKATNRYNEYLSSINNNTGSKAVSGDDGTPKPGEDELSGKLSSYLETIKSQDDMVDAYYYIDGLEKTNNIDHDEAVILIDKAEQIFFDSAKFINGQYWVVVDDGGKNFGGGINRNAKVATTDQYTQQRTTYSMAALKHIYKKHYEDLKELADKNDQNAKNLLEEAKNKYSNGNNDKRDDLDYLAERTVIYLQNVLGIK